MYTCQVCKTKPAEMVRDPYGNVQYICLPCASVRQNRLDEAQRSLNYLPMMEVARTLKRAQSYGLEVEVVAMALKELKMNPTLTAAEALAIGLQEWDI